jgi:hypothetical protein
MRTSFLFGCLFFFLVSCRKSDVPHQNHFDINYSSSTAASWANMTLNTIKHARYKSPTYSSRSLGYIGVTMYETVVYSDPAYRSLQGQLNQLNTLPAPDGKNYVWPLVLNSGVKTILKLFYPTNSNITMDNEYSIDSLYAQILAEYEKDFDDEFVIRSVRLGEDIGEAVFEWSKSDGGFESFLHPFDSAVQFPKGESYWVPPVSGQTVSKFPLHPGWGNNRTFSYANSQLPVPEIASFSKDTASEYYKLYFDVYSMSQHLTKADMEIAAWWADDPTETYSPPGHSFNLATEVVNKVKPSLVKSAETYARVGMAVADAFICCWKTKFKYSNERPSTYVRSVIDTLWTPFWPEPPFPAFPSGHSTQSAATATVLTSLYGDNFSFTDHTHEGATRFPFFEPMLPRTYLNFWESAEESGRSRLLGGIHTQQDNEIGLQEGKKIGDNINNILWGR